MKHLLMDPTFPDIVAQSANRSAEDRLRTRPAPSNDDHVNEALADPLFLHLAKREIAATRVW